MLQIKHLDAGYGKKQVLFDLSLCVRPGEIVALIGPNGAGKSTVLKAICGLIPVWKGEIYFNSILTSDPSPTRSLIGGIAFCPQGNRVFSELTVLENLLAGGLQLVAKVLHKRIDEVLALFPLLKKQLKQRAGKLSGGQQQILALARALMPRPRLLVLDEPSLGLSPDLVSLVFRTIAQINEQTDTTILVVEHKVREVLDVSDRVYSMKHGQVAFSGPSDVLRNDKDRLRHLFI